MPKKNFDGIAAGDNFTDKRVFTDKPLIKTENDFFKYSIELLDKKEQF